MNRHDAWNRSQGGARLLGVASLLLLIALATVGCSKRAATEQPTAPIQQEATALTADGYFHLGNTLFQQQDLAGAQNAFKQAIALDASNPSYYANLGVTYYTMGLLDDAIKSYETGLKLAPGDAELNYLLGAVYLQQDRLSDAQEALTTANRLDPNLPEPYFGLGVLYKLQGKRDEAIKAFEKFIEIGPGQDPAALPAAQQELKTLKGGQ